MMEWIHPFPHYSKTITYIVCFPKHETHHILLFSIILEEDFTNYKMSKIRRFYVDVVEAKELKPTDGKGSSGGEGLHFGYPKRRKKLE